MRAIKEGSAVFLACREALAETVAKTKSEIKVILVLLIVCKNDF
jgi:hypothetical protein